MKWENILSFLHTSKTMEQPSLFYFWLILAFFFLIMEIGHPGLLFFLSFSFGGFSAAMCSYFLYPIMIQCASFFGGMLIALCILRYIGIALMAKNRSVQQTNFYALKGKRAVVKQDIIGMHAGLVSVGGQMWVARCIHDNDRASIGDTVEIVDVRGAHVVVKKI
jgi:membrane protein implicated in regulation of membrane protease activity